MEASGFLMNPSGQMHRYGSKGSTTLPGGQASHVSEPSVSSRRVSMFAGHSHEWTSMGGS